MSGQIRIGTAGWSIASRNADLFPSSGTQLQRYAERFSAAEINSSFYRPHRPATYERWAQATPADFRFSVKLPRAITHERRLADCRALVEQFTGEIAGLGDKLGVVLIQLPPSLAFDRDLVGGFLEEIQSFITRPLACEPRHASWFTPEADTLLAERQVARVAADPAKAAGGETPGGWEGLAYWRWHGSPRVYFTPYGADRIRPLAQAVAALGERPAWVIFDNTASSSAVRDAAILQSELSGVRAL